MLDWGSHGLDMAQWGLGADESGPVQIWTEGDPFKPQFSTPERPGGRHAGPQSPSVFMKYPGDILMALQGSPSRSGVRFVGKHGTLDVTRHHLNPDPPDLLDGAHDLDRFPTQLYRSTNHYRDWLECIRDRRDPVADAETGHRTATVGHLGNIARWVSQRTGTTGDVLEWDPAAERFTNSDVANDLLHRTGHEPYRLPDTL